MKQLNTEIIRANTEKPLQFINALLKYSRLVVAYFRIVCIGVKRLPFVYVQFNEFVVFIPRVKIWLVR